MIREWFESLLTPAGPAARKLGYLYESIAFRARHRRHAESWRSHLERSHREMIAAAAKFPRHGRLMILGSGPLLEVPLAELKKVFREVVLVDLVHPRNVRRAWGRRDDVVLVERDLLGLDAALMDWRPGSPLPVPAPLDLAPWKPDAVISANCLSQLALIPRARVESLDPGLDENALDDFCRAISAAHLLQVAETGAPHLIIADFETRVYDRDGALVQTAQPYFDQSILNRHAEWVWPVAPRGELDREHSAEMHVGAFTLL